MSYKHLKYLLVISSFSVIFYFLYVYKLDSIPAGFYIDEVMPGYSAYSILKTGRDEYGKFLPLTFRFFGSYNTPLYTYSLVPFIFLFELSVFAVRLPSTLFGFMSVIPFYLLLRDSKQFETKTICVISSILFVISPWLVLYSRVGYEVSLGFLLFSIGIYFLWNGINNSKHLNWGIVILSVSTYASYTQRFLIPVFLISYFVVFKKKILRNDNFGMLKKGLIVALILQIPNLYLLTTPSFFPKTSLLSSGIIVEHSARLNVYLPHNLARVLAFLRESLSQYFTYYSPESLFFNPDPDLQRSIPELSVFYFWMIIPYFMGLFILWKNKHKDFFKYILILLLSSPIPAALTRDPFATHRAMPMFFPLMVVISLGIGVVAGKLSNTKMIFLATVFLSFSIILFWRSYFVLLPHERAKYWTYGYEDLSREVASRPETLFIIDQSRTKPSYIYLLFFQKFPPDEFQMIVDPTIKSDYYNVHDYVTRYEFSNLETRNITWEEDVYNEAVLVGDSLAISGDQAVEHFLEKIFEIKLPDGEIAFVGYKTNPELKCKSDWNENYCNK